MKKTLLVLKQEWLQTVNRKSFWIVIVIIPVISFVISLATSALMPRQSQTEPNAVQELFNPAPKVSQQGLIDQSGLIVNLPPDLETKIVVYTNEAQASQALENDEIETYYLIPADFMQTGRITSVRRDYNPLGGLTRSEALNSIIGYNLLKDQPQLYERISQDMQIERQLLNQSEARDPNNMATFFIPYAIAMLFYVLLLSSSTTLLNSISQEKTNRVMEILLTSISPSQMLMGKSIALALVGLLQALAWGTIGLFLMLVSGRTLNLPAGFDLPPSLIGWGILFFLGGYAIYGMLMAGIGALAPGLREASQATTIVILPIIIPLMMISVLVQQPNSTASLIVSFFPLTAPIAMMTRLAAMQVPFWQPALALVVMFATAWLIIRGVAGLFRAQTLLSGQPYSLKLFLRALIGKA